MFWHLDCITSSQSVWLGKNSFLTAPFFFSAFHFFHCFSRHWCCLQTLLLLLATSASLQTRRLAWPRLLTTTPRVSRIRNLATKYMGKQLFFSQYFLYVSYTWQCNTSFSTWWIVTVILALFFAQFLNFSNTMHLQCKLQKSWQFCVVSQNCAMIAL